VRILHVLGARPNFMKLAPCHRALAGLEGIEQIVVHTGQRYDDAMSDSFFRDLEIPVLDINLGVGSASHAVQTQDGASFKVSSRAGLPTRACLAC
jgi:UDP-N-acetylglucosamine 2-epimerase (non-hydrolysing)